MSLLNTNNRNLETNQKTKTTTNNHNHHQNTLLGQKQPRKMSAKLPKLSIQQQIDNNQIVQRMNRKITFTKNQRHLGSTITYNEALNTNQKFDKSENFELYATNPNFNQNKFKVIPEQVYFNHFQPHHTYQSEIKLINQSKHIQRIKITPFSHKQFVIFNVKYPMENNGDIAPGMNVTIVIRFRPNNLNDVQDELIVIVNGGIIKIPIIAKRERSSILWPKIIDCGHCWVGNSQHKQITIVNSGGEADYQLVGAILSDQTQNSQLSNQNNQTAYNKGYFKISPKLLKFHKGSSQKLKVSFFPQSKGTFQEKLVFKSMQGEHQEISIKIIGGAYNAQLMLQKINDQKVLQQKLQNNLYINGTQIQKESTANLTIKNLAIVQVDYFWHIQQNSQQSNSISFDKCKGKILSSQSIDFKVRFKPKNRNPQFIKAELYLFNLPQKSLVSKSLVKTINGIEAIQCLILNIKTRPKQSKMSVYPLHKQIIQPLYKKVPVKLNFKVQNFSDTQRSFKISKISNDKLCQAQVIWPKEKNIVLPQKSSDIQIEYQLVQLTKEEQRAYFLIQYDNSPSQIISLGGYATYPKLKYSHSQIYFGLSRTYTKVKKQLLLTNQQNSSVWFRIYNPIQFYCLQFYDFYEFETNQYKKERLVIRSNQNNQIIEDCSSNQNQDTWIEISPNSTYSLILEFSTNGPQFVNQVIQIQVKDGKKTDIPIIVQIEDVNLQMSRNQINLRQIYKGNVYNSNKFLNKELSIQNNSNISTTFQFLPTKQESCIIKIDPMIFTIPPKQKKRVDLLIEPIKTGQFYEDIKWRYYDDFKVNPQKYPQLLTNVQYNSQLGAKTLIRNEKLTLMAQIKGVQIKYYIKDQTRATRVRQKIQDLPNSVKHSTISMKSSKTGFHEQEKIIYPFLEEINFYNCEINQVRQMEIIIENDSGLTAQFQIYAEKFHTLQKVQSHRKSHKGLVSQQEEAFSSEMGKTFLKSRVLDKSQKVHLSNNKGISIMCEPSEGTIHKKQVQKIMITMFNDTSGRFKDNLVICVKNHQKKQFPIDIHIKGTPVLLSKNQLGINFNSQIPVMNLGSIVQKNGQTKKTIKVVNKGPKQVHLNWKIYPHNKIDKSKDLFKISFNEAAPGTNDLVQVKWDAIQPQIDALSPFRVQPREKILKGREQVSFVLNVKQLNELKLYQNLLICQPQLRDGQRRVKMQNLAVVVEGQSVSPILQMDTKHKNHINKLQLFAVQHINKQNQTISKNNFRKLTLKNNIKANLQFEVLLEQNQNNSKDSNQNGLKTLKKNKVFQFVSITTNSPVNVYDGNKTFVQGKKYLLSYESFIEIIVELKVDPKNITEWPMDQKVRKDGKIKIKYSNNEEQEIDLVGWLYRPWIHIQMPNHQLHSVQNFTIDFGTVHIKNSKKMSIYLINSSKVDGKFTITYLKYHQSKKINFQKALWTAEDYEDQKIVDNKKCFMLSQDSGVVLNKSIPVHYMPSTLALPSQQDNYTKQHKPIKIDFLFKPEDNVLYKSKFRISVEEGLFWDIVVRGRGSFDQQLQKKQ